VASQAKAAATLAKESPQIRWRFFAGIVVPLFTAMVRLRIREGSTLPAQGSFILSPNHFSEIDPIVMGVVVWKLRRTPRFLAKASLFRVPVLGWIMNFTGQIPVEREAPGQVGAPLKAATQLVKQGQGVIVYPEGTLTKDSNLWPMKGKVGAVRMALESGIPLYPAAHWGTQNLMGRYAKKIRFFPRTTIDVVVGEPLDLSRFQGKQVTKELLEEATEVLMHKITALVGSLRHETPPATLHDGRGPKERS
jgi:1-acyl-sn-glycerol-3-phosphate acyltransferase